MKIFDSMALHRSQSISDYIMLMKPELTLLSVSTAVGSAYIALHGSMHYSLLVHTLIGTLLVGGAAGVLNQYIERQYDAMMKRTEHRPLPAGRIQPADALFFGVILCISGLSYLALFTNWIAVSLSVLTLVQLSGNLYSIKKIDAFCDSCWWYSWSITAAHWMGGCTRQGINGSMVALFRFILLANAAFPVIVLDVS